MIRTYQVQENVCYEAKPSRFGQITPTQIEHLASAGYISLGTNTPLVKNRSVSNLRTARICILNPNLPYVQGHSGTNGSERNLLLSRSLVFGLRHALILVNSIGSPVEERLLPQNIHPLYMGMCGAHVVVAGEAAAYVWQYKNQVSASTRTAL